MGKRIKLPSFIIIGTIKGGTSGLYWSMCKHPKIQPAKKKELVYFQSGRYKKDLDDYRSSFNPCAEDEITGESTPSYILHEKVAQRIKKSLPNVKLLVLLRNPITRAYSQYYHAVRNYKRETYPMLESFDVMVKREMTKIATYPKHMGKDLLKRGVYIDQLKIWYKYFPKEQIKIIKSEDYFNNPNKVLDEVFVFLGLEPYSVKEIINQDKRIYPNPMSLKMKKKLKKYYTRYNKQLYKLIGRNMEWEKE